MIKVSKALLGKEELSGVSKAFDYGYFGHSSAVIEFENQLAKFLGAKHVVATNSGTAALHLSLAALGIGPGDEVLVPSLTFVACFQAITAVGATPVACEVESRTLCLDPADVKKKISSKTKVVMPVHYASQLPDLNFFYDLQKKGIRIVEDAAHSFGAKLNGKKIGGIGDVTCFSFDSIKNITCGEGGAVVTDDPKVADIVAQMRLLGINRKEGLNHGDRWKYDVNVQGYRFHMNSISAAIGSAQLAKIDSFIKRRIEICKQYDFAFKNISAMKLPAFDYANAAPHVYVVRVTNGKRDSLMNYLEKNEIETTIHYIPNHRQSRYKRNNLEFPVTEKAFSEILTLPLHCALSKEDVEYVINKIQVFFQEVR